MRKFIFAILIIALFMPAVAYANENTAVTRKSAVNMLTEILPVWETGTPFDDTDDPAVAYYRKKKIVHAISGNNFLPNREVTTEEFLIMLKRALDISCPDLFYDNTKIVWHTDQNEVSPFYQSQIAFLSAVGVYNNSGFLKPKSIISEGMARYYISLGVRAQNYGRRSKSGQRNSRNLPILMYHVIDYPSGPYPYVYVSEPNFEEQIKYFYDNGYTFLFPEELSLASSVQKPVVITFDDGYIQTYDKAYKILKKYNAKATLFMVSDKIGEEYYCNPQQLYEMSDSGVFRIYSHTATHSRLTDLSENQIADEFSRSNDAIYNVTGREVTAIAYPYGSINQTVIGQARRFYKTGFSVIDKGAGTVYEIPRTTIDDSISIIRFPLFLR